jgi:hypothetical protein
MTIVSERTAANQRNALKSTGPRTLEGKSRSRRNALKHGLTARDMLLTGEDPAKFGKLRQEMFSYLAPEGALEVHLVERVISLLWRGQRIPAFEVALLEAAREEEAEPGHVSFVDLPASTRRKAELGRVLKGLLGEDLIGKLNRYGVSLQKQLSSTLKELRDLQATRLDASKLIEPPNTIEHS